jgi:flagellar hook-length control protein FliK
LTATISVQRSDVQALLANELPALQHALADRNLHVEQISVLNNSINDRTGANGQQHQQQNSNSAKTANSGGARVSHASSSEDTPAPRAAFAADARNASPRFARLSVHA